VRLVQANGLDLSLFQFDYDLTFAAFFLNADRTLYGRFGTRSSDKQASDDISLEGFRKALGGALDLHRQYPANKGALAGKKGPPLRFARPEEYPSLKKYQSSIQYDEKVVSSCVHCHQVREAERVYLRVAHLAIPEKTLRPWPMPNAVGLRMDPREKAKVSEVLPDSPAARDGFKPGDEILTLEGQPLLSIADLQWILEQAGEPAQLRTVIQRGPAKIELLLTLGKGWRQKSEISWRPSTWDLRRMATGGLVLQDTSAAERRAADLSDAQLGLRVEYVGQYNEHAAGKKAGFEKNDIIVAVEGRKERMTETDLIDYLLQQKVAGSKAKFEIMRGSKRLSLDLPMQ